MTCNSLAGRAGAQLATRDNSDKIIDMESIEKRKFKRKKISMVVTYHDNMVLDIRMHRGKRDYEATMIDLSEEGMAILTDMNLPKAALMTVKFSLADSKDRGVRIALLTAKVMYSEAVTEGRFRVGIQFQDLNKENRERLKAFCCSD